MDRSMLNYFPEDKLNANHEQSGIYDAVTTKRSGSLRDQSIRLLQTVQSCAAPKDYAGQLEHITPQLERHASFQKRLKKWQYAQEFDAIELYNISTRLKRSAAKGAEMAIICHLRVVSTLLLECGRKDLGDLNATIRLFKTGIKTAKACYEEGVLSLAHKTLERCATFHEDLARPQSSDVLQEHTSLILHLEAEYYLTRIKLAKSQNNHQLAEYILGKVADPTFYSRLESSQLLLVGEAIFTYGCEQLKVKETSKAISWLQKCHQMVIRRDEEKLEDIRIQTLQNLVRAYLRRGDVRDIELAASLIDFAAEDYPVASWLYALRAEYATKQYPTDAKALSDVLESMVRIVQLDASVFQTIVRKLHDLHKLDLCSACRILDLLLPRTAELGIMEWTEKSLITRVWLVSQSPEEHHARYLEELSTSLTNLEKKIRSHLGLKVTHAAQILLWKASDGLYTERKFAAALKWCTVAHASVFQIPGGANDGKIVRRMIQCHLELGDLFAAKSLLPRIPEQDMGLALTRYLVFRVHLQSVSIEETLDNVKHLKDCNDFQMSYLYHCAIEATNVGQKEMSQSLLILILEEIQKMSRKTDELKLPALIRCIIKISKSQLEHNVVVDHRQLELICHHFDLAAKMVESDLLFLANRFNNRELDWFSKNAHNLALSGLTRWPATYILRLLACVSKFLDAYALGGEHDPKDDILHRKLLCHFLALCIRVFSCREETNKAMKVEQMSLVCKETSLFRDTFRTMYKQHLINPDTIVDDHLAKFATALVFEFEAQIYLASWAELSALVEDAVAYQVSNTTFSNMADLILSCSAPTETVFKVVESITNAAVTSRQCNVTRLSRWLRMTFTLCLCREPSVFDAFCAKLLDIIRDHTSSYPADEMQWLVARSFNQAVDSYSAGDHGRCHRLCELALNIGNYAQDDGLKALVQRNYQQMINSM